ncbi:hypothetical protein BHM03_00036967 [Ensete ventricosum]|nr:hypothetical protein BHM03_00036967 [Ensete ventricosum]
MMALGVYRKKTKRFAGRSSGVAKKFIGRCCTTYAKLAKPVIFWYQSRTCIRRNTCHANVGDIAGMRGGQPTPSACAPSSPAGRGRFSPTRGDGTSPYTGKKVKTMSP